MPIFSPVHWCHPNPGRKVSVEVEDGSMGGVNNHSAFVRRGAGTPDGWGLWRGPVGLWNLHLPQPPCTQPLRTVRDAAQLLSSALHRPPPPLLPSPPGSTECVYRGLLSSSSIPYKPLLPAEEEPLSSSVHLPCSCLPLLCTLTPVWIMIEVFFLFW